MYHRSYIDRITYIQEKYYKKYNNRPPSVTKAGVCVKMCTFYFEKIKKKIILLRCVYDI